MKTLVVVPRRCAGVRIRIAALLGVLSLAAGLIPHAAGADLQFIGRFGFGTANPADNTYRSDVVSLRPEGYVIGTSRRYVGVQDIWAPGRNEREAWLGRPDGSQLRLGLYDPLHTRDDGRVENLPIMMNGGGVSTGYARRFNGHADAGSTAWVQDRHGNLVKLGFYDAAHTFADGSKISLPVDLNSANQVVGYSERTLPGAGRTAWLAKSTGAIQRIGIYDAAHTSATGGQWSTVVAINNAGYAIGMSAIYNGYNFGEVDRYLTPWVRKPWGEIRRVGFQTGAFAAPYYGVHDGRVTFLTESGYIAGYSTSYNYAEAGRTAWVTHVSGPNRRVGIYDDYHISLNGNYASWVSDINELGNSAGGSRQPAGHRGGTGGTSAWVATPLGQTVRVGLYDNEHTNDTAEPTWGSTHQENHIVGMNEADAAIGYAERYDPITGENETGEGGRTAWVADLSGTTIRLGFVDAAHTRADGYRYSMPTGTTATRYVWGFSIRYSGSSEVGETGWIYDRETGTYSVLDFAAAAGDDTWSSAISAVQENGDVYGTYDLMDGSGRRAFFRPAGGSVVNLDDVVDTRGGFGRFVDPVLVAPNGYVAGEGLLTGSASQGVFLLKR